jgi:AraC family transcriptional regulator
VREFGLPALVSPPLLLLPFEVLSSKSIEGDWFRFELQSQDLTGRRDFDVQCPEHHLTFTPDGAPARVVASIDGEHIQPFLVRPGQLTLLPLGERSHGSLDGVGTRGEAKLTFQADFLSHASDAEIDPWRVQLLHSMDLCNPAIVQAMAALTREVERPGPMGRVYADGLVIVILTELVRRAGARLPEHSRNEALSPRLLRRVVEYIDAHVGQNLALSTLAGVVAMAPPRFAREFRQAMGLPAHRYLLNRRLECAAALLLGTKRSIADVALAIGFSSQAHLTSAFQRVYRTTPAVYRRQRS